MPTHQRARGVHDLLVALEAQSLPRTEFEVVVVDDRSSPSTWGELCTLVGASPLAPVLLRTAANGGPARARNLGWRFATGAVVAFIDDDCVPGPDWLAAGLAAATSDPGVGVIQGRTTTPPGVSVDGQRDWYVWRVIEGPSPSFEACNIFYRRDALVQVGGFDEQIGWWGEDTALGWSVVEAGWGRGFVAAAVAAHAVERRGWRWYLRQGLLETNIVGLAAAHPGYRKDAFWRAWAYRRTDAAFAIALAAVGAARWWRPAVVGIAPYLWWQRPSVRRAGFLRLCVQVPTVDAARMVGHLRGVARFGVGMV